MPGLGLWVCTMSGRSGAEQRRQLGQRAHVVRSRDDRRGVAQGDVADAVAPRAVRTYGPGADMPDHVVAAAANARSCGPRSSAEAHVGGGDVDESRATRRGHVVAPGVAPTVGEGAQPCPRDAMPPSSLRRNQLMPSARWMGERASRYGSVRP